MLDRKQVLGEDKEGKAWWNRKETKSQVDFTKMQPNPRHVDRPMDKQQKNQPAPPNDDNPKDQKGKGRKMGRPKGKASR